MQEILLIIIASILVNNVILSRFLGLCSFMGVTNKTEIAIGMSIATTFVITLSAAIGWILNWWILVPLNIEFLRLISLILIIASLVQLMEIYIAKMIPPLYQSLGIFLPLITTNCSVLGVALIVLLDNLSFVHSVVFGFSSSLGFSMVMIIFSGLRERQERANLPNAFAGAPINFITAGILALAFTGFAGLTH